ncbi:MAG: hypothetical protein WBM59_11810, partial [Sedimenticolaceae bacterium]
RKRVDKPMRKQARAMPADAPTAPAERPPRHSAIERQDRRGFDGDTNPANKRPGPKPAGKGPLRKAGGKPATGAARKKPRPAGNKPLKARLSLDKGPKKTP